jgi:hypothetical protein
MADLERDNLVFRFPEVHPQAEMTVTFIRTLRLPDDGKNYPLPPGLGAFPLRHVDDFKGRVPPKWSAHGGIMLPMYQSEALWLQFSSNYIPRHGHQYPFAVRVSAGKRSAVTGKPWGKNLQENDYLVIPEQKWIDGFVVENGIVKQFVAVPLGMGMTVEGQLSGKEEFGGIQIQVYPMRRDVFEKRFPDRPVPHHTGSILRGMTFGGGGSYSSGGISYGSSFSSNVIGSAGTPDVYSEICESDASNVYSPQLDVNNLSFNSTKISATYSTANSSTKSAQSPQSLRSRRRNISESSQERSVEPCSVTDMGLGAGGSMVQQVFKDPYSLADWDQKPKNRCYVHIVNSLTWQMITGSTPPTAPRTAAEYITHGLPWYDYYRDDLKAHTGTDKLKGVKTVSQMSAEKKIPVLPENQSATPNHVIELGNISDGKW